MQLDIKIGHEEKEKIYQGLIESLLPKLGDSIRTIVADELDSRANIAENITKINEKVEKLEDLKDKLEYYGDRGPNINKIDGLSEEEQNNSFMKHYKDSVQNILDKFDNISERFDNIDTKIDELDKKTEKLVKTLGERADEDEDVLGKIKDLKKDIGEILDAFKTIKSGSQTLEKMQGEINSVKETLNTVVNAIKKDGEIVNIGEGLKEILAIKNSEYQDLMAKAKEVDELKPQLKQKDDAYKEKDRQLDEANKKNQELDKQKAELEGKLTAANDKYNTDIAAKDEKIKIVEGNLQIAENKKRATEEKLGKWTSAVKKYIPVKEAMSAAAVFEKFRKDNSLEGDEDEVLFNYAVNIGSTIDFATRVYTYIVEIKKADPKAITEEEIKVYGAINKCYRDIWNIDFDIFAAPGDKDITAPFEQMPFNKQDSENMKDPRRPLKNITEIYAPKLKNREGKLFKVAEVDTSN